MVRCTGRTQYTAGLLEQRFVQEGVGFQMEPFSGGWVSYLYDNDVLPTRQAGAGALVRLRQGQRALLPGAPQVEVVAPPVGQEEEGRTFEDMPSQKAHFGASGFRAGVYFADYGGRLRRGLCANWLKGL